MKNSMKEKNKNDKKKGRNVRRNRLIKINMRFSFLRNEDSDFACNPLAIIASSLPTNRLETCRGRRREKTQNKVSREKLQRKIALHINKPYGTNFLHHPTQIDFKFIQNTIHISVIFVSFLYFASMVGGE
jgi:hypothetical protein